MDRSQINRALPALEERGLSISEDESGGLWPFHSKRYTDVAESRSLLCYADEIGFQRNDGRPPGAKMSGMTKAERLQELKRLYVQRAYSDIDMAERLGVDRTTIYRDRIELTTEYPIEPDEQGRYRIPRSKLISEIKVNLHEALTLYLAARKSSRQTRVYHPHAASAVEKLAAALRQPMTERLLATADRLLKHEKEPERIKIQEILAQAWVEQRKVRIRYRGLKSRGVTNHVIRPYLIEPSIWSDSIYVVAYSETFEKIIPFKVDRFDSAVISGETFSIPEDFDDQELLRYAWGIWGGEGEPERVVLRFAHGAATRRVKESIWHPLETVTDTEDGGCTWEAPIGEWQEMLPWVRGWGSDVEVVEPEGLREELKSTVIDLNKRYQILSGSRRLLYHNPYAKTSRDKPDEIHLLLYHLIDVGQVAHTMWEKVLTHSIHQRLANILNLNVGDCGRFLAFLAALHDLGKAGPAYQDKYSPDWLKKELNEAGLILKGKGKAYESATPHGTVSTWALHSLLQEMIGLEEPFARKITIAVGGHHGVWPLPGSTDHIDDHKHEKWDELRRDLFWELMTVFCPPKEGSAPQNMTELNTFLTILSGLTSVADWIGSRNKEHFGFVKQPMSTRQYAQRAEEIADKALSDLGWIGWQPTGEVKTFAETFAYLHFDEPRPIQQQVIEAARQLEPPTLLILEAPTGIGKTEIAMYLADLWLQQSKGRGLYVAMPTTATSNQMYERVGKFLDLRYPEMKVNYHLVHGQAAWADELKKQVELQGVGDDEQAHVVGESWFTPRKRTLLAPFGVGTVDQTLMSILQTKHFFVRLFGLSHKVIIFDEVHAYDTYMNTLFHRLLEWLNAIGTSVIILSATLPAKTRRELVKAYTGQEIPETQPVYPALTIANAQRQETIELSKPESYPLQLDWSVGREPQAIVEFLKKELAEGGCAAVICNTVRRAQGVYCALDAARQNGDLDISEDDLILFHGRFPPVWREGIEKKVLGKFGKPDENGQSPHRPHKAIVVATQVIEQSLDLDFDVMVTDLAPVDLILQRAGRLHRHKRGARKHARRLVITKPAKDDSGLPDFDVDKFIYAPYILLRSYLTLHNQPVVYIPDNTTTLIEAVYDWGIHLETPDDTWCETLQQTLKKLEKEERETQAKASMPLILPPHKRQLLQQETPLDEDDPTVHKTLRAQTRDIDLSLTLICLHKTGEAVSIFQGNGSLETFNFENPVPSCLTKKLLQNALSLQHKGVINHFLNQPIPSSWQKESTLRYCRFAIFENTFCQDVPGYTLCLSRELGLQITKKEAV